MVGRLDGLSRWEATLRAAWVGRDPALPDVEPLGPDAPLADQLAMNGFALVPGVFTPDEVETLRSEVSRLTDLARADDQRSWWARTAEGEEVCCRLLYTDEQSDGSPRSSPATTGCPTCWRRRGSPCAWPPTASTA